MGYTAPLINGWNWFPNRKGLVTGAIVAGFGSGGFIFNRIGSKLINPHGVSSMPFHFGMPTTFSLKCLVTFSSLSDEKH